ncbi:MAG: tRNA pseudouridine(38-40) synthase TruA [Verrucomicrobiales bacterium]|nr:tRNA pseudouridine(38-40) synthase TruA [Verrucomicrobiales bacterium]
MSAPDAAARTVRGRVVVAYDGSAYQGWQTQKTGCGVQQVLEAALKRIFPGVGPVHGSSRTDTGVHAQGLVAHFDVPIEEWRMTSRKLVLAVNAHLPDDVRIMRAARASPTFHARFDAAGKEYRYQIWNAPAHHPLLRRTSWHVPRPLEVKLMREAASRLVGTHDFRAFTNNPGYARSDCTRTLSACRVSRRGPLITVSIEGDGFLYKMCRNIAGTLVQAGLGKLSPTDIDGILAQRDRRVAGMTAPAHGLVLWRVRYGKKSSQIHLDSTEDTDE